MRPTIMILTALAPMAVVTAAAAQSPPTPAAHAQALEKEGRCRGPDGQYAVDAACKGAGAAPAVNSVYRLDAQGKCRDDKGRMAKAEKCGGDENAPAKAAAATEKQKP
jgi:hypothetical protein